MRYKGKHELFKNTTQSIANELGVKNVQSGREEKQNIQATIPGLFH